MLVHCLAVKRFCIWSTASWRFRCGRLSGVQCFQKKIQHSSL